MKTFLLCLLIPVCAIAQTRVVVDNSTNRPVPVNVVSGSTGSGSGGDVNVTNTPNVTLTAAQWLDLTNRLETIASRTNQNISSGSLDLALTSALAVVRGTNGEHFYVAITNTGTLPKFQGATSTNYVQTASGTTFTVSPTISTNYVQTAAGTTFTVSPTVSTNYVQNIAGSVFKTVTVVPYMDDTELADGDTAANIFTVDAASAAGKGVRLEGIYVITSTDISSTKPDYDIYFFDRSVTLASLNSAIAISDGDMAYAVGGPYRIRETYWEANGALNGTAITNGINEIFPAPNSGTSYYVGIRARKTIDLGANTNVTTFRFKFIPE